MNKKGFTLVELIVSFLLISIISFFLFEIVSIISAIYSNQGIKTELVLEQSNISNVINKDIYLNEQSNNYVKRIVYVNENQIDIKFLNGNSKTLYIDRNDNSIKYGNYVQKFLSGTTIGEIELDLDYINTSSLKYNGVSTIKIPISYSSLDADFDILSVIRFSSNEYAFNLEDDEIEYVTYGKYLDGTPIYFNVTTGQKCSQLEQQTNYSTNNVESGLNSGCMRFFAFLDDEKKPTVNLILDHNVSLSLNRPDSLTAFKTATDSWQGVVTPDNYSQFFTDAASNTATLRTNWGSDGYKARFITADEVAKITGRTTFESTSSVSSDYFFLDGSNGSDPTWQTQIANSSTQSNYWWLFDYLTSCPSYGCQDDSTTSTVSYWTADKTVGTYYFFWVVDYQGRLIPDGDGNLRGARPVIKVLKSNLLDS